ncbi:MAG: glutamate formimidoyltransferase [Saprospiraceae bacterium]|nr:glutamate formimidoyltransferase [Saprospiraceae bacterium]
MKSSAIVECVPNFSEGRDLSIISAIEKSITSSGVSVLNTDPGKSTNRTVITFAGHPDQVIEAAFQAIKTASELINMRNHKGEHPRMGATDVCPIIPIRDISIEEAIEYSKKLAERVGKELNIPIYLYEYSATSSQRKNLADIRSGEYEGFSEKIKLPEWKPDYGPQELNLNSGATVIGVRDFLIAYNVNLNTNSVSLANEVAFDIRENGRPQRDPKTNKLLKDSTGEGLRTPGSCPSVKAIGWYIDEYRYAQVSMNLTNMSITPLHTAFEECRKSAEKRGLIVTGSELVGLVPKKALLDAGLYFLQKQKRSCGVPDSELIHIAIQSIGLNASSEFIPSKRIIEDMLEEKNNPLINLTLEKFANETASDSPAPGGGSVSAYLASLGASLSTMVANLSIHKKGYEDRYEEFNSAAMKGISLSTQLLHLVDEDTKAFNLIMDAFRLPKTSVEEKRARKKAIQAATITAIEVPIKTIETALQILPITELMVKQGNPNSISDAGVGALCIEAAVKGAALNVKINAATLDDVELKKMYFEKADKFIEACILSCKTIIDEVNRNII